MESQRDRTVCFTGHRTISESDTADITARLYSSVVQLAASGFDTFIAGGAVGFDTMAAQCIAGMKERFPGLRLVLALPCRDQTARWKKGEDLEEYKRLLGIADEVFYAQPLYTDSCMFERNRKMVDKSSVCIAYFRGARGGTAYTYRYAEKSGLRIINICPDEYGRCFDSGEIRQLSFD